MSRNDEGEFELVVGNRQLMAVLFILFIVCGAVFGVGYWIGKNTAPSVAAQAAAAKPAAGEPASQPKPDPSPPRTTPGGSLPQAAADTPLAPGEAKVTSTATMPVNAGDKPLAPETAQGLRPPALLGPPTKPPEPKPAAAVKPVEAPKPAPVDSSGPQPGQTYLQVAAVKKAEADVIVDVLKNRGFSALAAPVTPNQPPEGLWRALVGPLKDADAIAKARADLQALRFKDAIVRRY